MIAKLSRIIADFFICQKVVPEEQREIYEYGFGIQSIRAIVKKYNGTVQFSQENGLFHCDAVLTR